MARLVHRQSGSTVVVPDEKAEKLTAMGYDLVEADKPAKKSSSKSEK